MKYFDPIIIVTILFFINLIVQDKEIFKLKNLLSERMTDEELKKNKIVQTKKVSIKTRVLWLAILLIPLILIILNKGGS